jgi:DNA-binding GntR family transcriptional regulator
MGSDVLKNTIREKIIELILSGKFKPGERIKEHTLSRQLQVSRTPLREALISLEQSKLVRSEPNVGFTVQEMSVEEIEELYPLLNLLENYALELAFPLLQMQIPELESMNESFYLKRHSPYEASLADCEFHRKLIELCKNETLLQMLAELRLRISCYEHCYMAKLEQLEQSYKQHQNIISAIREGNKDVAKLALSMNWEYGRKILLTELLQNKKKYH